MLTAQSYAIAIVVYVGAALLGLLLLNRGLMRRWPTSLRRWLTLALAVLLLLPAYPSPEADTLAPALIVAVFNLLFAGGWEAARPATLMLGTGLGIVCLVALVTRVLASRRTPRAIPGD